MSRQISLVDSCDKNCILSPKPFLLQNNFVELVEKKEFIATIYDLNDKICIIHITSFASYNIHPSYKTQLA